MIMPWYGMKLTGSSTWNIGVANVVMVSTYGSIITAKAFNSKQKGIRHVAVQVSAEDIAIANISPTERFWITSFIYGGMSLFAVAIWGLAIYLVLHG